jgi:hypothetical protein
MHKIENVANLSGKTITISFWAKADSNKNIALSLHQYFGTGGTPSFDIISNQQLISLTTTWQKKTITLTLPSIVGKTLGTYGIHTSYTRIKFFFDAGSSVVSFEGITGMIQQSGTFDIAQVKLEDGSVATDGWHPYDGEFGGEVQACQRYYEIASTTGTRVMYMTNATFRQRRMSVVFATQKRIAPSITATYTTNGTYLVTPHIQTVATSDFHVVGEVNQTTGAVFISLASYIASAEL